MFKLTFQFCSSVNYSNLNVIGIHCNRIQRKLGKTTFLYKQTGYCPLNSIDYVRRMLTCLMYSDSAILEIKETATARNVSRRQLNN